MRPTPSQSRARRAGGWASLVLAAALHGPAYAQPAPPAAPEGGLEGVFILGAAGLSHAQVQAAIAPLQGRLIDERLLEQVRLAVASAYDAAGLRLVAVDRPVVQGGVLLVRVHALRLGRIQVQPAEGQPAPTLDAAARAALPALREGENPRLATLDRQLRLANLQPHRRWALDFRNANDPQPAPVASAVPTALTGFGSTPGQTVASAHETPAAPTALPRPRVARPGDPPLLEARVVVDGADAVYGRAMLDNAGQLATGRERARLQLGHGDLFGPGRALDLTALASLRHPDRQHQFALRYQHPVPAWASLLSLELQSSRSRPGLVGDFFDVAGRSDGAILSLRHLLARQGGLEPYLTLAFEHNVQQDVIDFAGNDLGGKVGAAPLSLALGGSWQGGPWRAFGQVQLRRDTGWAPHSSAADYARARAGAAPHWTALHLSAELARAHGGGHDWTLRAQGQWTNDPLLPAQQMRVGGAALLRGLEESEMAGDRGLALAAESWWSVAAGHRVGLLLDAAVVHRLAVQTGESDRASAITAGLGWQWQAARGLHLSATLGHVLRQDNLPTSQRGDSHLHLLLDWSF